MNKTKTVKIGQSNVSNKSKWAYERYHFITYYYFFTILNIKPFKGIKNQTVKNNHLTGKHYGQVLIILNAVKKQQSGIWLES
jgi:hypothetical protein